ncbi:aldo/keto reductase [Mycolicibacterium arseniciresistens]|uniref:Aldo/keto reductase n=1 Tax=Mycolicibacterium arseniciresistens TaxID=3062257 RepID=A0ABT8UQC8_9MYCO|nr:aldo/keto reductase [Mycolicibacterium arseniciresistens]MDO3640011.1 aldo/keto reductase [Mycolicibacterium arseniciresistens]
MRYRLLGNSGLRVSEIALGTMTFGAEGWGTGEDEAGAIYSAFRDAGGNLVDTANEIYAEGRSEEYLGRLITGHRHEVVIATKYTDAPPGTDPNAAGNSRKSMVQSVERSLRRLGTDYVDLLWVHAWDFLTPEAEVMRALDDLVRSGKVLYVGISDAPAWVVARCHTIAELRGWSPFVGLQIEYNLIERTPERELLPMARALDITVVAWSPLASGILSGKYAGGGASQGGRRLDTVSFRELDERSLAIARAVGDVAAQLGCSSPQVALAWLRQRQPAQVIPIIGARTVAQFEDNAGCLLVTLDADTMTRLDEVSAVSMGFPTDFLATTSQPTYGGMLDRIDSHRDRGMWPAPE